MILLLGACQSASNKGLKNSFSKEVIIKAKPSVVWSMLTSEKHLGQWWNKGVRLEPFVGGDFYEPWGKGQLATGKVIKLVHAESITFTWKEKNWKAGQETLCTFYIKERNGRTFLRVQHSGWSSFSDLKERQQVMNGFKKGWDYFLGKLKNYTDSLSLKGKSG